MTVRTITTRLSTPAPALLTSLAAVHAELSIPGSSVSNDAWLARVISRVSRSIENYCNRDFSVVQWQDLIMPQEDPYPYQVPGRVAVMQASRWPIVGLSPSATVTENLGTGTLKTLTEGVDFLVDLETGQLTRIGKTTGLPRSWSDAPTTLTYSAGYAIVGEAWTVPSAPFQIIVMAPFGSFQADAGVTYANGTALAPVAANPTVGEYALIPASNTVWPGGYQFAAGDVGASILIDYGYVPFDIEDVSVRMVTARFQERGRDPYLKAKEQTGGLGDALGREEYWIGQLPGKDSSGLPPDIASALDNYRVPVTA